MIYKHTQVANWVTYVSFGLIIYYSYIWREVGFDWRIVLSMIAIVFILMSFRSLTVSIEKKYLKIKFGFGIFEKNYLLDDIISAKKVKNKWYFGYGIRYLINEGIWLYNISGLDAVELKLKNGKVRRFGTNDLEGLLNAINDNIKK